MYRNTRFRELMEGLPRGSFEKIVADHQADKHSKGFRCWDQLIALIYGQISGSQSLRELEAGFNSQRVHHYHLGSHEIKRSTLSDANANRNSDVFEAVCNHLLGQAHRKVRGELKDLLYVMDSTPIPLKGLGYDDWTKENHSHRTQGLKVHMLIAPDAQVPVSSHITAPNINDIEIGRKIDPVPGATYVFDKGYCDYNWWNALDEAGSVFVTRFKKNAGLEVVNSRLGSDECPAILEDSEVSFKNKRPGGKRVNSYSGKPLRRVVVSRPDKETPLILATNDVDRSASEIAQLYRRRWSIELFFKWLKQNLKIKRFLGRSENAVRLQIYTALITYLLVGLYRKQYGVGQSLKMLVVELRSCLFQRRETEEKLARRRRRWQAEIARLQGVLAL